VLTSCEDTLCVCSAALVPNTLELGDLTTPITSNTPYSKLELGVSLVEGWRYHLLWWMYGTKSKMFGISTNKACPTLHFITQYIEDELSTKEYLSSMQYGGNEDQNKQTRHNIASVRGSFAAILQRSSITPAHQDKLLRTFGYSMSSTGSDGCLTFQLCDFANDRDSPKQEVVWQVMRLEFSLTCIARWRRTLHQHNLTEICQ
jgi:hypothetical protein